MAMEFRAVDRDTPMLLPPDLRDWLPADHLVWTVLDVVGELDLSAIVAGYQRGGVGREAYDPRLLTGLLVYGYCQGVRSSRQIERCCLTDVGFRVVAAQQRPDHTTLARFRARHAEALAGLFGQVLRLCARAGMVRVGSVAVDGTKIAGQASVRKNYRGDKFKKLAADLIADAAATDAAEDAELGPERTGDELPHELAPGADRPTRIRDGLANAENTEAAEAAEAADQTEPADQAEPAGNADSAETAGAAEGPGQRAGEELAPGADRATRIRAGLAKIQAETDRVIAEDIAGVEAKLVRARRAAARVRASRERDQATRRPRVDRRPVKEHAEVRRTTARVAQLEAELADARAGQGRQAKDLKPVCNISDPESHLMFVRGKGYLQGFNAQLVVSDDHLIVATNVTADTSDRPSFVPMMNLAVANAAAHLDGTIELILADAGYCHTDALTAAGPDRLIATGRRPDEPSQPAVNKHIMAMAARLKPDSPDRERYKRRQATVEPVIGHLKDRIGLRRFSRRGLKAARQELALAATAHNIRRLALA